MIYLIGGPPRCGKTTLAKYVSKKFGIPWISTDTLGVIGGAYMNQKEWNKKHPYSKLRGKNRDNDSFYSVHSTAKIVNVLKQEARPTFAAVDMMAICEIKDGNDYIIEGYHIEPALASRLMKKYGRKHFRAIFLTKHNKEKFARDVHKSTTPNDWLLVLTKKPETFLKVGAMIDRYSMYFETEAQKYGFKVLNMDENFEGQIKKAVQFLK